MIELVGISSLAATAGIALVDDVFDGRVPPVTWRPARTKPEHADLPEEEFCGYDDCRHHMDSHDYRPDAGPDVPCIECPDGMCLRAPLRGFRCMACGRVKQLRSPRAYCANGHASAAMQSTGPIREGAEEDR
jgi:hypothetical protein